MDARTETLWRDLDAAARKAGEDSFQVTRAMAAAGRWAAGLEGRMMAGELSGGHRAQRRAAAKARRESLRKSIARDLDIPWRAFAGLVGFALRLAFPEYAVAVAAVNWLVGWVLDRWADDPDDLITMQLWGVR